MHGVDSIFEIDHLAPHPAEEPADDDLLAKQPADARRLIERRLELKRLRELLDEPDLEDFE